MYQIYDFTNPMWLVAGVWFLVASFFTFLLPGLVVAHWSKLRPQIALVVAPVIGLSLFGIQAYGNGYLNFKLISYLWLGVFVCLAWHYRSHLKSLFIFPKLSWAEGWLLFFGVVAQNIPTFGSGWRTAQGIVYYWINGFDGLFHLSLSRSLLGSLPPVQPGANDLVVTNYHYLSNLIVAEFAQVWSLPINHLYFQFFPILLSLWLGLLIIQIIKNWVAPTSARKMAILIALFLFYFAGELSWLFQLLIGSRPEQFFNVYIDNGLIQFLNPPQAFAKLVFLSVLLLLNQYWQEKSWRLAVLLGLLVAALVPLKVYFGIYAALGLASVSIYQLLVDLLKILRRQATLTKIISTYRYDVIFAIVAALVALAFYLPANSQAGGLFYSFISWPKILISPEKINWNEWWLRLQVYEAAGNTRALVVMYSLAAGVFLGAIYHFRLLGIFVFHRALRGRLLTNEIIFLLVPAFGLTYVAMNYLQVSGGANIFNFFVVSLVVLNLLASVFLAQLVSKNRWWLIPLLIGGALVVVQSFVYTYGYLRNYSDRTDLVRIDQSHEEALDYLSQLPPESALLQTHPKHYLNSYSPYLFFFTGQKSYLGGINILESHNQDIEAKKAKIDQIFTNPETATQAAEIAQTEGITDILLEKKERIYIDAFYPQATFSATYHWQTKFENDKWLVIGPQAVSSPTPSP